MPQFTSHGRFDGFNNKELLAAHPSPADAPGDIAFNPMQAAIAAQKLLVAARIQKDRAIQNAMFDRVAWLRRRSHLLQNGDTPTPVDMRQAGLDRMNAIANGEQSRIDTANQINTAQNDGAWKTHPVRPAAQIDPFLAEAVATPEFQACAIPLLDYLLTYKLWSILHFALLFPETRKGEIKMEINSPQVTTERRVELVREAADLSGEHAEAVTSYAIAEFHGMYVDHIQPRERQLLQIALDFIKSKQAEDIDSEKAFHAQHGLIYETGKLSKRRDATVSKLQSVLNPPPGPPAMQVAQAIHLPEDTVLSTLFGVTLDTLAMAAAEPAVT